MRYLFAFIFLFISFISFAQTDQPIEFKTKYGLATLKPQGLSLSFQQDKSLDYLLITADDFNLFSVPTKVIKLEHFYEIEYENNLKVRAAIIDDKLDIKIFSDSNRVIKWPTIVENKYLKSYLIPEGEGLFVPIGDKKLRALIQGEPLNHTQIMPFLGYIYNNLSMTIILHNPYRTIAIMNEYGKGHSLEYDFRLRDQQPFYEVSFAFAQPNILEPARIFKDFLKKSNQYVSLREKIKQNPEIANLAGALHIYVWGDGRTTKALYELQNIGITKAWVGYEEKPNITSKETWLKTDYVDKKFINLAKKMGYLIGAYDSYHTMQPPEKVDSYNTDFGTDFYTKGCVRNKDGKIASGFAGRGCSVSMTALEQTGNFIINDRIKKFKADGINSYFLDCHGMLEGYDDYDLAHSQTILTDIAIRLGHLKYLSDQHLVLGSEAATAYAIPFLAFSHGNFGTLFNIHYRFMKDKNLYGGWGPARKPAIFFKSIKANDKYAMRYDPQYRLPMLQAVFHESIVTTDRWDTPLTKFTNLYTDRFILEFIYGVPSIWNLDIATVRGYKNILQQLVKEFTPLHRKIMTEELTHFEYLSLDRLIQKTMFGDNKVIMIGNLKNEAFEDIPAKSIKIFLPDTNEVKIITPEKLRSF